MNIEELSRFTYPVYIKFLNILNTKYTVIPCSQAADTHPPYLILRHDVDGSLESALRMAKIDHDLGIKSTYTVLFSHKLYNIFEKDSFNVLQKILMLGHEIGVHYDVETLITYGCDPELLLREQVWMLANMLGEEDIVVTRHKDNITKTPDPLKDTVGFINTDSPDLFDLKISDGYRFWGNTWVEKLLSFKYDKVQLLVHPCLWTEAEVSRKQCLQILFDRAQVRNNEYRKKWLGVWDGHRFS